MSNKKNIRDYTRTELKKVLSNVGHPAYKGEQIFEWLYAKAARSFEEMTNLSAALRKELTDRFDIGELKVDDSATLISKDRAEKYLVRLHDGETVETVLIPSVKRLTVCVSTQVGCRFKCAFCASGMSGLTRNLSPGEIAGQVLLPRMAGRTVSNVVFMGVGEPLDNYDNLVNAILILNDKKGLNVGARKITVSTCGVADRIRDLSKVGLQIELAISLHAPNDELRRKIVPASRKWPLETLMTACEEYCLATKRKITLEYALVGGLNDNRKCAGQLVSLARRLNARVNIIPLSMVPGLEFKPSKSLDFFRGILESAGIPVTARRSKGRDISAACGQLRAGL